MEDPECFSKTLYLINRKMAQKIGRFSPDWTGWNKMPLSNCIFWALYRDNLLSNQHACLKKILFVNYVQIEELQSCYVHYINFFRHRFVYACIIFALIITCFSFVYPYANAFALMILGLPTICFIVLHITRYNFNI